MLLLMVSGIVYTSTKIPFLFHVSMVNPSLKLSSSVEVSRGLGFGFGVKHVKFGEMKKVDKVLVSF